MEIILSSLATAKSIKKNLLENGLKLKTLNNMKKFKNEKNLLIFYFYQYY